MLFYFESYHFLIQVILALPCSVERSFIRLLLLRIHDECDTDIGEF